MSRAGDSNQEVEVKIRIGEPAAVKQLLRGHGFRVTKRRVFEANEVFDTPGSSLRQSKRLLRLRRAGRETTLTFKDKPVTAKHKTREEIELTLSDPRAMGEILVRLGYQVNFRYEKFRTEFARPVDAGTILLDETPIGNFLELEGTPLWIDQTAALFGFAEGEYINASYGSLYFADCASRGVVPSHMVFPGKNP
jgi:adenylate cyclase class 2